MIHYAKLISNYFLGCSVEDCLLPLLYCCHVKCVRGYPFLHKELLLRLDLQLTIPTFLNASWKRNNNFWSPQKHIEIILWNKIVRLWCLFFQEK